MHKKCMRVLYVAVENVRGKSYVLEERVYVNSVG